MIQIPVISGVLGKSREAMSGVDTAWLRMENPRNLMMVAGVMVFDEKLDFERFEEVIRSRFLSHARFRQRAVQDASGAYWETDADFDLARHVHRTALPGKADKAELQALVSDLVSTPLDSTKPMWQFHYVENYGTGSAVIARIHHCYADGIALIHVMMSMTDPAPGEEPPAGTRRKGRLKKGRLKSQREDAGGLPGMGALGEMLQQFYKPAEEYLNATVKLGGDVLEQAMEVMRDPERAREYARQGMGLASELAHVTLMPDDPDTSLRGKLGVSKSVAWAEPLPLDEVKVIGKGLGCTVNDVLLSCVTGALRSHMLERGDAVDGLEIRATVPVNLRPLEESHRLGNHFGLVFLTLPVGVAHPIERLFEVHRHMNDLKGSYQAVLAYGLLAAIGLGPARLQQPLLDLFTRKATAVMTNVPGPRETIYMAGQPVREQMVWVPQNGTIGVGVSILSYDGKVQFGLITDKNIVADPQSVIDRFAGEFEQLVLATMMQPWEV